MGFLDKPHQLWIRKAAFQIHLWAGLLVCLYMLAMGISGSILVFKEELYSLNPSIPKRAPYPEGAPLAPVTTVLSKAREAFPKGTVLSVYAPNPSRGAFSVTVQNPVANQKKDQILVVDSDPATGAVLSQRIPTRSWVDFVRQFHFFLLLGGTGWKLNGYGAIVLFVLSLTGMIVWWPGLKTWRRGLTVNFRLNWKRVVFDLHGASGFWTLGFLLIWAGTTLLFVWGDEVRSVVKVFAPLSSGGFPRVKVSTKLTGELKDLEPAIAHAQKSSPGARFMGVDLPVKNDSTMTVYMAREKKPEFATADYYIFEPATGRELGTWRRGFAPTRGDRFLELMYELHFGTAWGMLVKIIWAAVGLVLPVLTITSLIMYWNRYLSRKWKQLKQASRPMTLDLKWSPAGRKHQS